MKPNFSNLLTSYPTVDQPCDKVSVNQCAIRMSIALAGAGVSFAEYTEPKCPHGHARGAESLANWLWKKHLGPPRIYSSGATAKEKIQGQNGIVFFKDCFTREGETERRGDHIDLWDGSETTGYDDPGNVSKQVWFWPLS